MPLNSNNGDDGEAGMFSSVIYSFPVAVEIFPIGLKMTLSANKKSALRCKSSARLVTSGYSALMQNRDLKALCQNGSKGLQRPCLRILVAGHFRKRENEA